MTCDKVQELLTSYIDNELSEKEYNLVSIHLEQCPECSLLLQYIKEVQVAFDDLPEVDPPERIRTNVMKAIAEEAVVAEVKEVKIGWQWKRAVAAFILFAVSLATGLQPLFAINNSDAVSMRITLDADANNNEPAGLKITGTEGIRSAPNTVTPTSENDNAIKGIVKEEPPIIGMVGEKPPAKVENTRGDNGAKTFTATTDVVKSEEEVTVTDEQGQNVKEEVVFGAGTIESSNEKYTGVAAKNIDLTIKEPKAKPLKWYERIPKDRIAISVSGILFSLIMLWYSRPKKV